jgi:hypothetical protein
MAPPLLTLDGDDWLASHPDRFILGEMSLRYPLDRKQGVPQRRPRCCREENNLAPSGIRTTVVQPVAVPTELFQQYISTNYEAPH